MKTEQLPKFLEKVIAGSPKAQRQPERRRRRRRNDYYWYDRGTRLRGAGPGWTLDQFNKMTDSAFVGRFLTERNRTAAASPSSPVEGIPALRSPASPRGDVSAQPLPRRIPDHLLLRQRLRPARAAIRQQGADAFVSSLTTGKGVAGVEISWLELPMARSRPRRNRWRRSRQLRQQPKDAGSSSPEGRAVVALKEPALDLAEFDIGGLTSAPVRLFAYSSRNLYRPGESSTFRSWRATPTDAGASQPVQACCAARTAWRNGPPPGRRRRNSPAKPIRLPADAATGFWNLELRADPA